MENNSEEEALTIKVSSLTCIDLHNSDLHQSAVLLKQVCTSPFLFFHRIDNDMLFTTFVKKRWCDRYGSFLFQACLDSGFFYVINHGISEDLKDEAFEQSKKFFALPMKEKMKVLRNKKYRGYSPLYDQLLDPVNQVRGSSGSAFTCLV